jgi:hypothetical protein
MTAPSTFLSDTRVRAAQLVSPVGDLTAATTPGLRTSVARSLSEGARRVIVDLSQVTFVDQDGRDGLAACSLAADAAHAVLVTAPARSAGLPGRLSGAGLKTTNNLATAKSNDAGSGRHAFRHSVGAPGLRDVRAWNDHRPWAQVRLRRRSFRHSPGGKAHDPRFEEASRPTRMV